MRHRWLRRCLRDDLGQDLIEYAFLLMIVALATIIGLQSLGLAVTSSYGNASTVIATGARGGGNPGNPTPGAGTPGQGNPGGGNPGNGNGPGSGNGNGGNGNGNGNGNGKNP
jgi:Flp pilus assembly pilin Flp